MVIDANMCTIRVLEPLAEEIATMKAVEGVPRRYVLCFTWLPGMVLVWCKGVFAPLFGLNDTKILNMVGTIPLLWGFPDFPCIFLPFPHQRRQ
jgi:hypothetical protein